MIDFDIIIDELLEREEEIDPDPEDIDLGGDPVTNVPKDYWARKLPRISIHGRTELPRKEYAAIGPPGLPDEIVQVAEKLKDAGETVREMLLEYRARVVKFNKSVQGNRKLIYKWLRDNQEAFLALEPFKDWNNMPEIFRKLRGAYMADYNHAQLGDMVEELIKQIEAKHKWWKEAYGTESTQEG